MVIKTTGKRSVFLTLLTLIMAGTLIAAGCSGGGGGVTSSTDTGTTDTGSTDTGSTDTGSTVAKATLSGTLLTSSSSGGSSLFKRPGKAAAATSSDLPASGATVLCFDTDSVSTAATGSDTTDSSGNWTIADVDAGNYACFGIYIDLTSLTIKTTKLDDIAAAAGETVTVDTATVESDTTSPTIVSVLSDNVADTSLSDGDPDPLYEVSEILPGQVISVIFSEAMNTSTMQPGTGAVLKDSTGTTVTTTVQFNGSGTEFRYIPSAPLTTGEQYTLYLSNKVKDLSNNGINDPDSDGVIALARLTVAEQVDQFAQLSSNPKNTGSGVNVYQDITITFNRPVDFVSFKENTVISPAISGRIEPSGDGVTILHLAPLTAGTDYTITIGANVADLAANTLGTPVTIAFSTGAALDTTSVAGFDPGVAGTADDLVSILTSITKAELAISSQDIISFASFFTPDFTLSMRECSFNMDGPMPGDTTSGDTMTAALESGPGPGPGGGEVCRTETLTLQEFLDQMKKDFTEERNMAKGFGEVERMHLFDASGNKMSVEHFNSDFDTDRNPVGADLYVGWPNPIPGIHYIDAQIDATDSWGNTWNQFVKYRLDPSLAAADMRSTSACTDVTDPSQTAGVGEVLVTYHKWDQMLQRDQEVTQLCQVIDGDGDPTNEWASDNEVYPSTFSGMKNVWDDNDGDMNWNEDGLISLRDTNNDGVADAAYRLYSTSGDDPMQPWKWTPHEDAITLPAYTVAAAMVYAANQNWDIEGVDNDGDSSVMYWGDPPDPANGGDINRRVNEDWPDGADNDGDCDPDKDGISNDANGDGIIDGTGRVCVDEDNDGMRNDPSSMDGDDDTTNDPMPWNDWNLANKDSVLSSDELYAQVFLVKDSTLAPGIVASWEDESGAPYYEIPGPKGWSYTYAVGADGRAWSGDELQVYNSPGDRRDGHDFANGNITVTGKFYFNNEDSSTAGVASDGWGVMADLSEATPVADSTSPSGTRYRFGSSTDSRYQKGIYKWTDGFQTNADGETIDWMYMRPKMDTIDYNADGDWNPATDMASGVRRVPHDRITGGVMSDDDYLALGWDTWRVSYDYQLIIDPLFVWDVEADWARMEGDDDGDGLFNEDGLYSDYFNSADGSLKTCASSANYPCMTMNSTTGVLTLYKKDGTTTTSFDISDGVDNDFDGSVDEEEPWDDDGDGSSDEDPIGDPNDLDNNGDTTAPYNDDSDSRTDEDPISYERDRLNDHSQWSRVYQSTTDAVVQTFYLERDSELTVEDIAIDSTGLIATAVISIVDTETWSPHNPWGDDFDRDGVPDDVRTEISMMIFKMEKTNGKWLVSNIHEGLEDMADYETQLASGDIKQFGGMISRIEMVSPVGDQMTGPSTNATTTPTFQWDDSAVTGTIGSYLIHIEEITEGMVTSFEQPSIVMMVIIDPLFVTSDSVTGVKSFQFGGSGTTDITDAVLTAFASDPYFPFDTALAGLEDGKAYSWGIMAFSESSPDFSAGKPEPMADSFEPMMFATGALPAYFTNSSTAARLLPKAKVGGTVYNTIPSNIAPSFYDKPSGSNSDHGPSSLDPRSRR